MHLGSSSSFVVPLVVLVLIGWAIYRRMRAQRVRLTQTVVFTALIVLVSASGVGVNEKLLAEPLFVELAPVLLVAGLALGWVMMRTIRFWRDESTGQVWMAGGIAYVAIWLAIMALRLGISYTVTGGFSRAALAQQGQTPTTLSIITSDLIFLSMGLWLARGYALVRRYREFTRVLPQ
jgi:hypothetical protein